MFSYGLNCHGRRPQWILVGSQLYHPRQAILLTHIFDLASRFVGKERFYVWRDERHVRILYFVSLAAEPVKQWGMVLKLESCPSWHEYLHSPRFFKIAETTGKCKPYVLQLANEFSGVCSALTDRISNICHGFLWDGRL